MWAFLKTAKSSLENVSLKSKLLIAASFVLLSVPLLAVGGPTSTAYAQNRDSLCEGLGLTGADCDAEATVRACQNDPSLPGCAGTAGGTVSNIITTVINILSLVVGVVAVIMIIIGGLKYITSSGDSNNVSGAKNTILYAVIGLVIVALAQVIVRFVLNRVATS